MFVFGCEQKLHGLKASFFFFAPKLLSLGTRLRPSWKKMRPEKWRPASVRKILRLAQKRFFEPCKSSTAKQMVHWWILGASLSNQRRKLQRMLVMDIRRNADRLTLIYPATLSRFGSGPTAVQTRSHLNTQLPNADTIDFFFGPRKRGVRPHPPNPPWLRACKSNRSDVSLKALECVRAHACARARARVCVCVLIKMIPNQSWICKYPCCKWNELYQHTIAQNLKESRDVDISSPQNVQMNDVWQHQDK